MDNKLIDKIINENYTVLKAFDVVDGDMTVKEFFEHIAKRQRTKGDKS